MEKDKIEEARYRFWLNGIIPQHNILAIKKNLEGIFTYSSIKFGEIKKGQGDIVIINLKAVPELEGYINFEEYFIHTHLVDRLEIKGIFTNIYWSKEFFAKSIEYININK